MWLHQIQSNQKLQWNRGLIAEVSALESSFALLQNLDYEAMRKISEVPHPALSPIPVFVANRNLYL